MELYTQQSAKEISQQADLLADIIQKKGFTTLEVNEQIKLFKKNTPIKVETKNKDFSTFIKSFLGTYHFTKEQKQAIQNITNIIASEKEYETLKINIQNAIKGRGTLGKLLILEIPEEEKSVNFEEEKEIDLFNLPNTTIEINNKEEEWQLRAPIPLEKDNYDNGDNQLIPKIEEPFYQKRILKEEPNDYREEEEWQLRPPILLEEELTTEPNEVTKEFNTIFKKLIANIEIIDETISEYNKELDKDRNITQEIATEITSTIVNKMSPYISDLKALILDEEQWNKIKNEQNQHENIKNWFEQLQTRLKNVEKIENTFTSVINQ